MIDELLRFEAFDGLGREARALLARSVVVQNVPRGVALLDKGEPIAGAYVVLRGRLRVFTIARNGAEATLYFVSAGETCVFSLNCLFNDLLYPAWVQAEAPTRVAVIPGAICRMLFETERVFQRLTVQGLSSLVFRLMIELEHVHSSNHRQRLAQFLLLQADTAGVLRMTQQHISQHLGTAREVVARLLRDFAARGYLTTARRAITVRDVAGLRRIVAPERA